MASRNPCDEIEKTASDHGYSHCNNAYIPYENSTLLQQFSFYYWTRCNTVANFGSAPTAKQQCTQVDLLRKCKNNDKIGQLIAGYGVPTIQDNKDNIIKRTIPAADHQQYLNGAVFLITAFQNGNWNDFQSIEFLKVFNECSDEVFHSQAATTQVIEILAGLILGSIALYCLYTRIFPPIINRLRSFCNNRIHDNYHALLSTVQSGWSASKFFSVDVCYLLEYKHGRKTTILFELMANFPRSELKLLLKLYCPEEEITTSIAPHNKIKRKYDKFNLFMSQGINKSKTPKQAALLAIKGMSYLVILQDQLKNIDPSDLKKYNNKKKVYEACVAKFDSIILNSYKDNYSDFSLLTKATTKRKFYYELNCRLIGNILWGFFSSALIAASLSGTNVGIGVGIGLSLAEIGIPLGISILVIFGIIRMIMDTSGEYFNFTNFETDIYMFLKKHQNILIQQTENKSFHKNGFSQEKLNTANNEFSKFLEMSYKRYNVNSLKNELYTQVGNFYGYALDNESIKEINIKENDVQKLRLFNKIKDNIKLGHCYDKHSTLEFLYRITHILSMCNISYPKKIEILCSLFKDLSDENSPLFRLRLENSFIQKKRWFVPHFFAGIISSTSCIINIIYPLPTLQPIIGTVGDVLAGQSNRSIFQAPTGNTKCFQLASKLIKNYLLLIYIQNKSFLCKSELGKIEEVLNQNTSRKSKIYPVKTKSAKIFYTLLGA